MKIIFVVLLLIAAAYAEQVNGAIVPKEHIVSLFIKTITKNSECADNTKELRKYWFWLPPSFQDQILNEVVRSITSQFPRIPYETVVKLVRNFVDDRIEPQEACDYAWKIISEEVQRREVCVQKCIEDNLSLPRLLQAIAKCKINFRCYLEEVEDVLQSFGSCMATCLMKNNQITEKVYVK